jgi:hypothetical protein
MFKTLLYVWIGLFAAWFVTTLSLYINPLLYLIIPLSMGVILFFITLWYYNQEFELGHITEFLLFSIAVSIFFSYVIGVPLTLMFRSSIVHNELGLWYIPLIIANIVITALPVAVAIRLLAKHFLHEYDLRDRSLTLFALTGLLCLPLISSMSLSLGIPDSFVSLYYLAGNHSKTLPESPTTRVWLPDITLLDIAQVDKNVFVVTDLGEFGTFPKGTLYCPELSKPFFEQKRFVMKFEKEFTIQFDDATNTINFAAPPFEVYIRPVKNLDGWQQIESCQTSVTLLKDVYTAITDVLVVFVEPDMKTFRAYTYNKQAGNWQTNIVRGSRDYLK